MEEFACAKNRFCLKVFIEAMRLLSLEKVLAVGLLLALGLGSLGAEEGVDKLSEQEMEKLDELRLNYDLARGEIGIKEWVEPMEKLRKGYREKMQKVQDGFAEAKDLKKAIAARTAAKNDPAMASIESEVKEIADIQKIFIATQKKIQQRLDESLAKLARSHVSELSLIKIRLTKLNRLDAAIFVDESIQKVVAELGMQTIDELKRPSLIPGGSNITKLGLVAYYPFNGNARDESGNRNDGKVNGATLTTDRHGRSSSAVHFDGDSYIETNRMADSLCFSVSGWFLVNAIMRQQQYLVFDGDSKHGKDLGVFMINGKLIFRTKDEDHLEIPDNVSVGVWYHYACVADSENKTKSIFLNGMRVTQKTQWRGMGNVGNHYNFSLGAVNDGAHLRRNFNGKLDDIRIYNRALSDKEVRAIYNSEKPRG